MQQINNRQSGMTMAGTMVVLVAILVLGIIGFKTAPAYAEFYTIKDIVASLNESSDKTRSGIKETFQKRAQIDNITSMSGDDLVMKEGVISAEYEKVIPLFGNMSLLLEFDTKE